MSFGETLTVTYPNWGAKTLTKVTGASKNDISSYFHVYDATDEATYEAFIRHTKTKAGLWRHNIECRRTPDQTDPDVAVYPEKVYMVWERHTSITDPDLPEGLSNLLIASTSQAIIDLSNLDT